MANTPQVMAADYWRETVRQMLADWHKLTPKQQAEALAAAKRTAEAS